MCAQDTEINHADTHRENGKVYSRDAISLTIIYSFLYSPSAIRFTKVAENAFI